MKFYTRDKCNVVFTIKAGASTVDLIEVEKNDILDTLIEKGLVWPIQALIDDEALSIVLQSCDSSEETIIDKEIDLESVENLSESCSEVIKLESKLDIKTKAQILVDDCSYDVALSLLDHVCSIDDIEQDYENDKTIYTLSDKSIVEYSDDTEILIAR